MLINLYFSFIRLCGWHTGYKNKSLTSINRHASRPNIRQKGELPGGSLYAGVMCLHNLSDVVLPSLLMAPDGLSDGSSSHRVLLSGGGRLMKSPLNLKKEESVISDF